MRFQHLFAMLILAGLAPTAQAHTGFHPVEGWLSGFSHPFLGLDHLLAMLAVGLWAVSATPDPRRVWQLPVLFMAVMVLGGVLGSAGWSLPGTETGIAASLVLFGAMVVGMTRLPRAVAMSLAGLFALFHGFAHGAEMAQGTDLLAYALGFVCATGLLHLAGLAIGWRLLPVALAYRASGAAIAGVGFVLLMQAI